MSDFRLNVIAETQKAEQKLKQVDAAANSATKPRKLSIDTQAVSSNFKNLQKSIDTATNNIQQFYTVTKKMPVIGAGIEQAESQIKALASATSNVAASAPKAAVGLVKAADAGNIVSTTFKTAASTADSLIIKLAKIGFSIYALKESTNILKTAFGGLFSETVGRAARFQETLLKTQTTLASTSRVFKNDTEITDPLQKIISLQSEIEDRVNSIRIRSIDLAGVTSNDVVEVFGMVASQIGQIGGGLKEAEDLAINFAAALGTFGIPLYQARQEVGSILRGDITTDSYLAKALGITNEDIARAKTEAGGVIAFLEKKLGTAVAGQVIAAKGLAGVLSNIRDIAELLGQALGEPLLDPIIAASTALYNILFKSKDLLLDIGTALGNILKNAGNRLVSAFQLGTTGEIAPLTALQRQVPALLDTLKQDIRGVNVLLNDTLTRVGSAVRELLTSLTAMSSSTLKAFRELLDAFIQLQLVSFESLISAVATLAQGLTPVVVVLTKVLEGWADILRLPIVQFFAQISITFAVLQKTGVIAIAAIITQLAIWSVGWQAIVAKVKAGGAFIQGVIKSISISLGSLLLLIGQVAASLKTLLIGQGVDPKIIKQLNNLEVEVNKAGRSAKGLAYNFRNLGAGAKTLGRSLGSLLLNVIKANLAIIAVTVGITLLVDAYGRWKRAQEETRQALRDTQVIDQYVGSVQYLNRELSVAEQKLKDAALAAADKKYEEATERLAKLTEEYKKLGVEIDKFEKPTQSRRKILAPTASLEDDVVLGFESRRARRRRQLELEIQATRKKSDDALAVLEKERDKDRIKTLSDNRVNLEKEIGELRRQLDNDLFQQRQARAQQEVEIFRLAGELRIKQIERANEKLIEGEEGASRTALEALNNYIATRERGELEIEAAKKTLVIEVANLEKSIADYKLDIAKKIAEIEKKSADYQRDSADARQRAAGGRTPAAPGVSEGFRVGSTGTSTGPHLDIRSPTGNKQAVIDEATAIIKAWQGQGLEYIELSNAKIDVKNMFNEAELRKALAKEQVAHDTSRGRRPGASLGAIDIAVPAGTLVPTPAGTPSWGGAGGWQATSLQTGNIFLHGLDTSVASPAGGAAAPAAPAATSGGAMPNASAAAQRYAEAVRGVAGAMERVRALQAAITEAQTAEAFENIAKAAFPRVALEQYQDKLFELDGVMHSLAKGTYDAFNPERSQIAAEQVAKQLSAQRELDQIVEGIRRRANLSEREKTDLVTQTTKRHQDFVKSLRDEEQIRQRLNAIQQGVDLAKQFAQETAQIARNNEVIRERNRLINAGASPEIIERELEKLRTAQQFNERMKELEDTLQKQLNLRLELQKQITAAAPKDKEKLQKELDEALAEIKRLQAIIDSLRGEKDKRDKATDSRQPQEKDRRDIKDVMKEWEDDLKSLDEEVAAFAETIQSELGGALAEAFSALIEGTGNVQQAFSKMFQNIYQSFLRLVSDMIAKQILLMIFKGFGIGAADGAVFKKAANGGSFANGIAEFSRGGTFTNSVVNKPTFFAFRDGGALSPGIMGEAGPEAIMPLHRGPGGKLGVIAHGGDNSSGTTNVVVNVDATGSSVQGDNMKASELGRAVSTAVQQELIKQKRPGGLLA